MGTTYPRVHAYAVGQEGGGKRDGVVRASVGVQAKRYCLGHRSCSVPTYWTLSRCL